MKRPSPTIEDIIIPQDKQDKLDIMLKSNRSRAMKDLAIRNAAGGRCHRCELIPTKIVKYHLEGITLAERYCDSCFNQIKGEIA